MFSETIDPANTCVKAIKTMIRTKSGRLIEKTIYITEEDYNKMMKEGGDPSSILNKYLKPEERGTIQSWEKVPEGKPMKVRCGVLVNSPLYLLKGRWKGRVCFG